jgi:hypothetical protein
MPVNSCPEAVRALLIDRDDERVELSGFLVWNEL